MEYEIDDDPQGLPDRNEGDRDGGIHEDRMIFRFGAPERRENEIDDASDEDSPIDQFGEAA
ncbi:hypothetical protein [Qipengyuania sp.]|uniref:hypothetical protein n=1 Tax=Qipengyuania sp. TaxID=2004515 RepID=UPI0035C7C2E2